MTKNEAISKLLAWANAQIGYHEVGDNGNKYAAIAQPLIGWNAQNQPWCDIFTDAGFIECFGLENASKMTYQPVGGGSAACRYSAQFFKSNSAWSVMPEVGDVIFFFYDGDINHQGIVVNVSGGIVYTVEGNSSDMVARRAYSIGSANIAGYGRPDWSVVAGSDNNVSAIAEDAPDISNATVLATYTVQPGDTLYGIAAKTGVPFADIVRINKIKNPNIIHVGEVFKLKDGEDAVSPPSSTPSVTDLEQVANRVIRGEFGNGVTRTILLKQQGYDPDEVQKIVNKILLGG